jgi:hypothetical protein
MSAYSNNGVLPAHGLFLAVDGSLPPFSFSDPNSIDMTPQTIGGIPSAQWQTMTQAQRSQGAASAAAALPNNWTAHRVGHVVFTYNGIVMNAPQDPGLWLFVFSPDPADGSAWLPEASIVAMRADGMSVQFSQSGFGAALATQNALRQQYGLPALPDPATVREIVVSPSAEGDE